MILSVLIHKVAAALAPHADDEIPGAGGFIAETSVTGRYVADCFCHSGR